jgi:hypothetical protein
MPTDCYERRFGMDQEWAELREAEGRAKGRVTRATTAALLDQAITIWAAVLPHRFIPRAVMIGVTMAVQIHAGTLAHE